MVTRLWRLGQKHIFSIEPEKDHLRNKDGTIFQDMMLQQSTLAAAKRVVRRMEWGKPKDVSPKWKPLKRDWLWVQTFFFLQKITSHWKIYQKTILNIKNNPKSTMFSKKAMHLWIDLRLEVHDPAALVACCQQLVECSVGIRPEERVVNHWIEKGIGGKSGQQEIQLTHKASIFLWPATFSLLIESNNFW